MIDLTLPEDALSEQGRHDLVDQLTRTLMKWENAPEDNPRADSIAWGYVHPVPAGHMHVGHRPASEPRYRVQVTVPEGSLDAERKEGLVADVTRNVLEAEGAPLDAENGMRVWVLIHEVPDGHWGGAGRIFRFRDIARFVLKGEAAAA